MRGLPETAFQSPQTPQNCPRPVLYRVCRPDKSLSYNLNNKNTPLYYSGFSRVYRYMFRLCMDEFSTWHTRYTINSGLQRPPYVSANPLSVIPGPPAPITINRYPLMTLNALFKLPNSLMPPLPSPWAPIHFKQFHYIRFNIESNLRSPPASTAPIPVACRCDSILPLRSTSAA